MHKRGMNFYRGKKIVAWRFAGEASGMHSVRDRQLKKIAIFFKLQIVVN